MGKYTKKDIINIVKENDVRFIRLQFTDIFGCLKNIAIPVSQLEKAMDNKCMFDGSSIDGFVRIEESDMCLRPDLDSFVILPWLADQQGKMARLICDVYQTDGSPFEGDPRYILKKVLREAADMGYTVNIGPECEFFLFYNDETGSPTTMSNDKGGYFDMAPVDIGSNARRDICANLEEMGFEVEASHHEVAPAQHEIDFKYEEALATADNIMTFKLVVKAIAQRHGLYATFMPKPKFGVSGSGMHINISLEKSGRNIFCDFNDAHELSKEAYSFMAGLMGHIKGITAVANPLVNSYKRLVSGYEAPVFIAWSHRNRSPLIRIPASREQSTRIELRSPDPTANPYLTIALCVAAGLSGIKSGLKPKASVDGNIFEMTEVQKKRAGIESLPEDLHEAIKEFEKDKLIRDVLGGHIFDMYMKAKNEEWDDYKNRISEWEIDSYLDKY